MTLYFFKKWVILTFFTFLFGFFIHKKQQIAYISATPEGLLYCSIIAPVLVFGYI